jgi:hypothetical protein
VLQVRRRSPSETSQYSRCKEQQNIYLANAWAIGKENERIHQPAKKTTTSFSIPSLKHPTPGFGLESSAISRQLETSINQARGGGQAIADNIREPMEQAFGADFSFT